MSKRLVVLSTEEKVIIGKILAKWIEEQDKRPYMSDMENVDKQIVKHAYYNKFKS